MLFPPGMLVVALLLPSALGPDWPHQQADPARRGGEGPLPDHPTLLWKFKAAGDLLVPPAVASGRVVVLDADGKVTSLSLSDGKTLWNRRFTGAFWAAPAISGGRIFAAISRRETRYETTRGGLFSPGSAVAVTDEKGEALCLDLERGQTLWSRSFSRPIPGGPAVEGERLVLGSTDYKVHCLSTRDGAELWSYKTSGEVVASPAIVEGRVLAPSRDRRLYCLDLESGQEIWAFKGSGEFISPCACVGGRVFAAANDGNVFCMSLSDGKAIWRFSASEGVVASPVVSDRRVYVASGPVLHCLSGGDGEEAWSVRSPRNFFFSPAVSGERLVISSRAGHLLALDSRTGEELWKYPLVRDAPARLALAPGRVLAATAGRCLYCLGEGDENR